MTYPYPIPGTTSAASVVTGPYFQVGNECCGGGMTNDVDATTKVTFDYTNQLPAGVNVSSITYTVTPPADQMLVISNKTTGNTPTFMVSGGTANSYWTIEALATLSDGQVWVDHITVSVTDCGDAVSSVNLLSGLGPIIIANTLYYNATAGQQVFNLSSPDKFSRVGTLVNSNVLVYGAGDRQVPVDNYTVSVARNTVTFLNPLTAGESVVFDLVTAPPPPVPPVIVASGVVSFTLYYIATAGQEVFYLGTPDKFGNVARATDNGVHVYRNGNLLVPGDSFTLDVSANRVTLANPAGVGESVIIDLLSESSSTSILNERLVFNSLADIEDKAISSSIDNIVALSYAVPGDLRGMPMELSRVGIAPTFPGWVQSLDGAYWQLKMTVVTPFMFGAYGSGDSLHDDWQAITDALVFCTTNGGRLHFPAGKYYSSQTINVVADMRITGEASGIYLTQTCAITFPAGVTGIAVTYPSGGGTQGVVIDGLDLRGANDPTGASPVAHGITAKTPVSFHRVNVYSFTGNGFNLEGYNFAPPLDGSVDLSKLDECCAAGNQRSGFYCVGQDANVITFIKCSAGGNGWYGFWDDSFLGCNYISCHSASNGGGGGLTTGVNASICYYGGIQYCVVPVYEQHTYPLPSTTTPGTDNAVWWPVTRTTNADDWVHGKIYSPGGPYCNTNLNARTVLTGCYAEGTNYAIYFGSESVAIVGGLLNAPITGPYWNGQGTIFQYNGISTQNTDSDFVRPGAPPYAQRYASFGTKDTTGANIVMQFSNYSGAPGPGYTGFQAALSPVTGDWNFANNVAIFPYTGYLITGDYTTHQYGSPSPQPSVVSMWKLGLSEVGDDGIVITYGAYSPQGGGGSAGLGWIVFNTNPTPGGNVGWVCTTAGDNATTAVWKTFGAIAP